MVNDAYWLIVHLYYCRKSDVDNKPTADAHAKQLFSYSKATPEDVPEVKGDVVDNARRHANVRFPSMHKSPAIQPSKHCIAVPCPVRQRCCKTRKEKLQV